MGGKLITYGTPTGIKPKVHTVDSSVNSDMVISRGENSNKNKNKNKNKNNNNKNNKNIISIANANDPVNITRGELQHYISVIQSRANFAGLLGQTFGGDRDVYDVLGYKKSLEYQDYYNRFKRDNVAKRIVSAPARATWANKPILTGVEDGDNKRSIKDFNKIWRKLDIEKRLLAKISRADIISGIGKFGILLIGINDGRDLSKPLGKAKILNGDKSTGFLYASAYSEKDVNIKEYDDDVKSPRFGMPKMYTVNTTGGLNTASTTLTRALEIHHSRIVHIAEDLLENEIFGTPRLEPVYNLFDDLNKVIGGSAEFFWQTANRGIHWDIDKDMDVDKTNEAELSDEIDSYGHGLKRHVKTRGITAKVLGADTADPRGPFSSIISLISGTTGIPQRILLGSERGQLASSQDRSSWNERISERQITHAEPNILRPVISIFQEAEILEDIEYDVEWPIIFPQTEDEKSTIAQRYAVASKTASQQVRGNAIITPEEFGKKYLGVEEPPDNEKDRREEEKKEDKKAKEKIKEISDIKDKKIDDGDIEESPGEQSARPKETKDAPK